MNISRISPDNVAGLLDKVIGLGKEIVGHVLDRKSMIEAGEAQQDKGSEKLKALREQVKADAHAAKARTFETKQRTLQAGSN
jgi:uncharacterized protein YjbJ (UPF0337 family)